MSFSLFLVCFGSYLMFA